MQELAIHEMEEILDRATFIDKPINDTKTADYLATTISNKIDHYKIILARIKSAIEDSEGSPAQSVYTCCSLPPQLLKYHPAFGVAINKDKVCDTSSLGSSNISPKATKVLAGVLLNNPGVRWQYWMSTTGLESVFPAWGNPGRPCDPLNGHHSRVFMRTLYSQPKTLVIVLDRSLVMTPSKMVLARSTVKYVLNLLDESDRVSVITVDSGAVVLDPFPAESCLMGRLVPAGQEWKFMICNHCQELAPHWLHKSEQLIRSQVIKLTQLLTVTTTHTFPLQAAV